MRAERLEDALGLPRGACRLPATRSGASQPSLFNQYGPTIFVMLAPVIVAMAQAAQNGTLTPERLARLQGYLEAICAEPLPS